MRNSEIEQNVIGAILLDGKSIDYVADMLTPADFSANVNNEIYRSMLTLTESSSAIDVVTVDEELQRRGINEFAYLASLAKNIVSARNITHYAKLLKNQSIERQLLAASQQIKELVLSPGETQEKLDKSQSLILGLNQEGKTDGPKHIASFLNSFVEQLDKRFNQDTPITGLSTSFPRLDGMTAGFQNGDLIVIAGRPSMGKTTFAMNIAEDTVLNDIPVAVFSLEMSSLQLVDKSVSSVGNVSYQNIRTGKVEDYDWPRITQAVGTLQDKPLLIDESSSITINEIRARSRRMARQYRLGLIVIDYLQLISMPKSKQNKSDDIGDVTRGLKILAKELNVPVIVLSQLNRDVEKRPNKRPMNSDLRDSGSIEADADVIMFIYRDEYYNKNTTAKGLAEVILSKQRNGPTGMVPLEFRGERSRFLHFDGDIPEPEEIKKVKGYKY